MLKSDIWRWYKRHKCAVSIIMELACDAIPGAGIVKGAFKVAKNLIDNKIDQSQEKKEQLQLSEVQKLLEEIKPKISDFAEELEELKEFNCSGPLKQQKSLVEKNFKDTWNSVLKEIGPAFSKSGHVLKSGTPFLRVLNNKYGLLQKVGAGGEGEVYKAWHLIARKEVAVKLLPMALSTDPTAIQRLRNEYNRLVDRLGHPNIVQYRELGQDEQTNQFFIVMDFVDGQNLRSLILEKRKFSLTEAVNLLRPIAEALDFTHRKKIVHCDLKPENILIARDGRKFLTDFGLSNEVKSSLASKRSSNVDISGTLPYMAPEQYKGKAVRPGTDVWAVGVVLYEMLAGRNPFDGKGFEHFFHLVCKESPDRIPTVSDLVWTVLFQMLNKDVGQRPSSVVQCLDRIGRAVVSDSVRNRSGVVSKVREVPKQDRPVSKQAVVVPKVESSRVVDRSSVQKRPVVSSGDSYSSDKEYNFWLSAEFAFLVFLFVFLGGGIYFIQDFLKIGIKFERGRSNVPVRRKVRPRAKVKKNNLKAKQAKVAVKSVVRSEKGEIVSGKKELRVKVVLPDLPGEFYKLKNQEGYGTEIEGKVVWLAEDEFLRINLSKKDIGDDDLVHLKGLKNLTRLNLDDTKISDAGLVHLKGLKKLTYLNLWRTQISDAGLVHLKGLKNLTSLNLSFTKISDAGLVHLKGWKKLTSLDLDDTKISDAGLVHLKGLKNLTSLDLWYTKISDAGLVHLQGLKNLTSLDLGSTQISDAGLVHLKGLKNLTSLNLSSTQISDAGLVHLKGLKNLTSLHLSSTQISDAGLVNLKELKNLTSLYLSSTKVTVSGIAELKKALPNLYISR